MAMPSKTTGLTYQELCEMFPEEDHVIRELIDGELFVTAAPILRHQDVIVRLVVGLSLYAGAQGGKVYPTDTGVYLDESNFVEPDVCFIRDDHLSKLERPFVRGAPDLIVEVSSPSTRRRDLTRKRDLYERFGVPEYWFVDLDTDQVHVYRLSEGRFGPSDVFGREGVIEPPGLPGFSLSVDELLGPPGD